MRLTIFLFILLFKSCLFSQSVAYLYPVKVDHKWGYVDKRGRIVVEPKYDAVGDQNLKWHGRNTASPFRLVEVDGKLGLIDGQCKEALAPIYYKVSPLSNNSFLITEDTLLRIVDRFGNTSVLGSFESVMLLDSMGGGFFKIKKGGLWGVYGLDEGEILPAAYTAIEMQRAGAVFFKIKKPGLERQWQLVNKQNRQVLPDSYSDIRCVNGNFFATLEMNNQWHLRDSTGQLFAEGNWTDCLPLNRHFIQLVYNKEKSDLFSCLKKDTISVPVAYQALLPFNDDYILFRDGVLRGLLDKDGKVAIRAQYSNIQTMGDTLFRVQSPGGDWGILSLTRGLVLPCEYESISDFKGNFSIVKKSGLLSLIGTDMQELIPPAFENIVVSDTLIKAYADGDLTLFTITENGQVALLDEFAGVRTLRIGHNKKHYQEALPAKSNVRATSIFDEKASPYTAQTDGQWVWKRDMDSKRWGVTDQQVGMEWAAPPRFVEVLHLKKTELSLVFTDEESTENTPNILPAFSPVQRFLRAAFFDHKIGKFSTSFDLMGLRGFDFEQGLPLAVFLDKNGRFGLIDREGQTATLPSNEPLRFTWIGEFCEGKARFCKGGRLALAEEGKQEKTAVDVVGNFFVQFGLNTTQPFGAIQNRGILIENKNDEPLQWGYIDTLGNIIIDPQFDYAGDFEDKFSVNSKRGLWGVIDLKGEEVLPFKYNNISPFHGNWLVGVKSPTRLIFNPNGYERVTKLYTRQGVFSENRCQVQMDSLWGFIDEEGNEVIPCQYVETQPFSEGLAAVKKDGKWIFIGLDGAPAFDLSIDGEISSLGSFSYGLAWFKMGFYYGYINKRGTVEIPPDFTKVFDFKFGVARAVFKGKTGLIDITGQWILKPERFEYVTDFNQWGVAEAREKFKGKRCLINAKGEVLTPLKYADIGEFHEGFAKIGDGKFYGLLNTKGQEVLPMEYEAIGHVSEGLLQVRPRYSNAWIFVDTLGKKAFDGEFEMVEPFQHGHSFVQVSHFDPNSRYVIDHNGKAMVMNHHGKFEFYENGIFGMHTLNGERDGHRRLNYYFADSNGKPLFDRLFEKIQPYKGETALVQAAHRWGMLNRNGLFVLPPKYPVVNMQENGEAVVNLSILQGLVSQDGEEILPPVFDRIELMSGNLFRLEMGEKVGYAKKDGEWVWDMQK